MQNVPKKQQGSRPATACPRVVGVWRETVWVLLLGARLGKIIHVEPLKKCQSAPPSLHQTLFTLNTGRMERALVKTVLWIQAFQFYRFRAKTLVWEFAIKYWQLVYVLYGGCRLNWMGRLGVNHLLCSSSNIISLDNCPSPPPNLRFLFKYWARSHHISDIQDIWSIRISPDSLDSSVGDANRKRCNTQL